MSYRADKVCNKYLEYIYIVNKIKKSYIATYVHMCEINKSSQIVHICNSVPQQYYNS